MAKNKLDIVTYCKILDMFGELAAKDTLNDVNEGRVRAETIEKYLYDDNETKEEYAEKIKNE